MGRWRIKMIPRYSVYIISKGRADICLTAHRLDAMGVPYKIVIEPCELKEYSKYFDTEKILLLPFENLGQGSIPARNWVWEYSISQGEEKHWILDDNIIYFYRLNRNLRIKVETGTIFRCAEDFTDRYTNIALSGLNYKFFCIASDKYPAYYQNTRIYSCILIDNKIPFRWRGRYNEDTDLSLRVLKAGYCTILFNAFLADKAATMTMRGGNTDNVYIDGDKRLKFAQSLQEQHPDVVKVVERYGRYHHDVDYRKFRRNRLMKKDTIIKEGINEYGMKLIDILDK